MRPPRPGGGLALTLAALLVLSVRPAAAGGPGGMRDGFLLAPADAAALGRTAGEPPGIPRGAWFALGQTRLWGMPELPVAELAGGLAVALAGGMLAIDGDWVRTGRSLVRTERLAFAVGWHGPWEVRLAAARERLLVEGRPAGSFTDCRLAVGPDVRFGADGRLALRLWVPLAARPRGDRRPLPAGRVMLTVAGGACTVVWERRQDGLPAIGVEGGLSLAGGAGLTVRWDGPSGSLGPGLVLHLGPLLLRSSHLAHAALGLTHRFELAGGRVDAARR